jgi:hypothetical protein
MLPVSFISSVHVGTSFPEGAGTWSACDKIGTTEHATTTNAIALMARIAADLIHSKRRAFDIIIGFSSPLGDEPMRFSFSLAEREAQEVRASP